MLLNHDEQEASSSRAARPAETPGTSPAGDLPRPGLGRGAGQEDALWGGSWALGERTPFGGGMPLGEA